MSCTFLFVDACRGAHPFRRLGQRSRPSVISCAAVAAACEKDGHGARELPAIEERELEASGTSAAARLVPSRVDPEPEVVGQKG
jgi:hypothetical protein